MNISYNWLKCYLPTDLSAEEIARILTDIGLEVEGFEKIETIRGGLQGVVVAEVKTCTDHPDSDHLHVTTVDVGSGEPLQIVCGAPNCRAGMKTLCATVGSVLYPNGGEEEFKIKRSKIRGVESLGMLCAEDELGIGSSHEGIMELPADAPVASLQDRTAPAWQRLKFDELLAQQITLAESRRRRRDLQAPHLDKPGENLVDAFLASLPFALTNAQKRVWREIEEDLGKDAPMHRLVQGDVGSGKTVVAALSLLRALECGHQAVLMAPTELLAEQHAKKLREWFEPLGISVFELTGRLKASEKRTVLEALKSGAARVAVGTHALIQEGVAFDKLGLCVIDEQHRFGVEQRLKLKSRGAQGTEPHLLLMSATPIPRTLAMSYLADLSVSVIDELPPGRTPVDTRTLSLAREDDVVGFLARAVAEKRQIYWVCPLVEESDKLDLTAAADRCERLRDRLPDASVDLLHGQMTAEEKDAAMRAFIAGETDILVSTTVIEVGVDVPNASVMVIEHAERFGLAQLHQLRGRVGRGSAKSFCLLLFDPNLSEEGRRRLSVIRATNDGFEVARHDLQLRGPGEFLGERQSGVPMLRFADLEHDEALLVNAVRWAPVWLEKDREAALEHARRWFKTKADYLGI